MTVQRKRRRFNERGEEGVERGDWELSGGRENNQLESIFIPLTALLIILSLAQDEAFLLCAWTSEEALAGIIGMKE